MKKFILVDHCHSTFLKNVLITGLKIKNDNFPRVVRKEAGQIRLVELVVDIVFPLGLKKYYMGAQLTHDFNRGYNG